MVNKISIERTVGIVYNGFNVEEHLSLKRLLMPKCTIFHDLSS